MTILALSCHELKTLFAVVANLREQLDLFDLGDATLDRLYTRLEILERQMQDPDGVSPIVEVNMYNYLIHVIDDDETNKGEDGSIILSYQLDEQRKIREYVEALRELRSAMIPRRDAAIARAKEDANTSTIHDDAAIAQAKGDANTSIINDDVYHFFDIALRDAWDAEQDAPYDGYSTETRTKIRQYMHMLYAKMQADLAQAKGDANTSIIDDDVYHFFDIALRDARDAEQDAPYEEYSTETRTKIRQYTHMLYAKMWADLAQAKKTSASPS